MRAGALASQQRQQSQRQREAGEIVDGEAQLDARRVDLPPRARSAGADSGVVDQQVEPRRGLGDLLGEAAHGGEVREVGGKKTRAAADGGDRGDDGAPSLGVAAVDDDVPAVGAEPFGDETADAVGRAGDERDLARLLRHGGLHRFAGFLAKKAKQATDIGSLREARMAEDKQAETKGDPRARIVDALLALAAEQRFEEISIAEIAGRAQVSFADFRDAFPSKGAILAGFARRIDRAALSAGGADLDASKRDRLFDALMRRLDAMAPYREGLREIVAWLKRDPIAALAMNASIVNSLRFALASAEIDSEGVSGAIKLQGLALAWTRIVGVWLDDSEPDLSKTMAELDRELTRGERAVAAVEGLERFAAPFVVAAQTACAKGRRAGETVRRRARGEDAPRAPPARLRRDPLKFERTGKPGARQVARNLAKKRGFRGG